METAQVNASAMRCGKAVPPSRQRAQASGAADVLTPAGRGGEGGGRSREDGSGGGTGTEAGIAMGGVGVVEYQSIDIIERPPHDPGPLAGGLLAGGLTWAALLLLPSTRLRSEPLERHAGRRARPGLTSLMLGLRVQTVDECFSVCWRPATRAGRRHPANLARACSVTPWPPACFCVCSSEKGACPRLHIPTTLCLTATLLGPMSG